MTTALDFVTQPPTITLKPRVLWVLWLFDVGESFVTQESPGPGTTLLIPPTNLLHGAYEIVSYAAQQIIASPGGQVALNMHLGTNMTVTIDCGSQDLFANQNAFVNAVVAWSNTGNTTFFNPLLQTMFASGTGHTSYDAKLLTTGGWFSPFSLDFIGN